jgi:hypothetical protein
MQKGWTVVDMKQDWKGQIPVPEVRRAGGRRYAPDLAPRAESSAMVSRVA